MAHNTLFCNIHSFLFLLFFFLSFLLSFFLLAVFVYHFSLFVGLRDYFCKLGINQDSLGQTTNKLKTHPRLPLCVFGLLFSLVGLSGPVVEYLDISGILYQEHDCEKNEDWVSHSDEIMRC
ncbi:hypothetical protein V1527DRAFT_466980 [Lipomyces starkeyi]